MQADQLSIAQEHCCKSCYTGSRTCLWIPCFTLLTCIGICLAAFAYWGFLSCCFLPTCSRLCTVLSLPLRQFILWGQNHWKAAQQPVLQSTQLQEIEVERRSWLCSSIQSRQTPWDSVLHRQLREGDIQLSLSAASCRADTAACIAICTGWDCFWHLSAIKVLQQWQCLLHR